MSLHKAKVLLQVNQVSLLKVQTLAELGKNQLNKFKFSTYLLKDLIHVACQLANTIEILVAEWIF